MTNEIEKLATRIGKDVVKTLRKGGAVVDDVESLRESVKRHIQRKNAEGRQRWRDSHDFGGGSATMSTSTWSDTLRWLDDWDPTDVSPPEQPEAGR